MKTEKQLFFFRAILISIVLIIPVPLVDIVFSLLFHYSEKMPETTNYSFKEMILGVISETIRAFITCYLYSTTIDKGSTIIHGIKFGMLYSALIASLYIILGGFYFKLENPLQFVIVDSLILILQGIVSGVVLYYIYRRK